MENNVYIVKEMNSNMYCETLAQLVSPLIHSDEEFKAVMAEWDDILEKNPKVAEVLDWGKEHELGKEDSIALHRVFELQDQMHNLEKKALFIAVQNQMLGLFLQYENGS